MDQSTLEKQIITINEKISISKRKLEDIEEDSEDYEYTNQGCSPFYIHLSRSLNFDY